MVGKCLNFHNFLEFWGNIEKGARYGDFSFFSFFHLFFLFQQIAPRFFCGANRTHCPQNIKNPPYGKSLNPRKGPFCQKLDFSVFLIFSENLSKFSKNSNSIKFLGQFPPFAFLWPSLYLKIKSLKIAVKVGHPTPAAPFWPFLTIFPRFFSSTQKPSRDSPEIQVPSNSLDNFAFFCLFDHVSISKFSRPKMPSKSGTLRSIIHCAKWLLWGGHEQSIERVVWA